ncbi:MAG TPA: adenylate/guanylate cyclase domain-containing protein [Pyrinomonadaceae bacterium]|nr:adenylate/guanylate cyclase domain-containing protein [Pyrinomonadaceae bacterium]
MREFHYRWEYDLQASPEELWPLVADTNRFNRDAGVPAVKALGRAGNARRLQLSKFGVAVEWEEQPFEWIRPYRFGVVRRYTKGPVREMRVEAELNERPEGGTHLVYQVRATPRNVLGRAAIPVQVGVLSKRSFAEIFRRYDREIKSGRPQLYQPSPARFAQGGEARLKVLSERLITQGAQEEIVKRLAEAIERADDITLSRMRSHALADYWGFPRKDVLEVCLWATRVGLLDLQWEMICPHCRGAAQTSRSLTGLQSEVLCETCDVDFTVNFDRAVELTFRPNPSVRIVEGLEFCVGGPQVTPHIVLQQLLAPGARREITLPLEKGRYRLRGSEVSGGQHLAASDEGAAQLTLRASDDGWIDEELSLSTEPKLILENATDKEQYFVLERMAWSDQAATAAEVTALQIFRDLFSNEALRPGEQISVGTLTVLFTDLRGSTQLYREIGDAPAFGCVMNHFDVLREAISEEDGALVKTIGDAVMAVFRRPAGALRAFLTAQQTLASPQQGERPLMLKVGIHTGPCIAVTLNGRLDYFGCTVNLAARLEGLSSGGDVVISSAVHADPEVAEMLYGPEAELEATPFEVMLKGFDEEQFELWRVAPASCVAEGERAVRSNV